MKYLNWHSKILTDLSENNISDMYNRGYVFTRIGKGAMQQTRSVRIDLLKFNLSSENRRILKKVGGISLNESALPLASYDFALGKLAKDFYGEKFGPGIMSANKVKEMLTDPNMSNFNVFLNYADASGAQLGHAISYTNSELLHYSYPFYDLNRSPKDMGLGMMTLAIEYAKKKGLKYVYLGSLQRPGDVYKLQFEGLEWFDGKKWSDDIEEVKRVLSRNNF